MTDHVAAQSLARIDVQQREVAVTRGAPGKIISVTRVTLPAFEVVYRDADGALDDAQSIRTKSAFEVAKDLEEPPGSEVVIELALADAPFSVTLLFRVIGSGEGRTVLEWWARRSTDSRMLELWIDALGPLRTSGQSQDGVSPEIAAAAQSAMELYRRVLSSNPFDVLGIHWTAGPLLVEEACASIVAELEQRSAAVHHHDQVVRFLRPCVERVEQAAAALATVDGRIAVRAKMVPAKELGMARKQAEYLLQLAERGGAPEAIRSARELLSELGGPSG
ncbi:MAG: hypothetical protein H6697_02575 [Myxococcales bacterium]|nr:hypothetical protein [Myxococcales bacterium]MCB9521336.1 hypothetical protein [Myxococcales bacterium]